MIAQRLRIAPLLDEVPVGKLLGLADFLSRQPGSRLRTTSLFRGLGARRGLRLCLTPGCLGSSALGLRACGPLLLCRRELLFQSGDEALAVRLEPFRPQAHSVAPRQRPDRPGQRVGTRHAGATDQHRDDALALVERGLDLDRHEVVAIASAGSKQLGPARPDHSEQHVACGHLPIQHLDEIVAGPDVAFHIHEQVLGRELVLEPLEQGLGEARVVAAAVVDEDLAGHAALEPLRRCLPQ